MYFHFVLFQRFWNIIGEKEVCAVWKPNEEFCHIVVDTGIFDHHMPDSVQGAVERLYQHQIQGKEKLPEVTVTMPRTDVMKRAKTVGAALVPKSPGTKEKKKPPVQYLRSNTEPDGICVLESEKPVCKLDIERTIAGAEMNGDAGDVHEPAAVCKLDNADFEETITAAGVNGGTNNVVDSHENAVEVTIHVPMEANSINQDEATSL